MATPPIHITTARTCRERAAATSLITGVSRTVGPSKRYLVEPVSPNPQIHRLPSPWIFKSLTHHRPPVFVPAQIAPAFLPVRVEDEVRVRHTCSRRPGTLLHGGFARRVLTSRRLRSCYSSEYRTPELVHPVEGLDGNCNFSRTTGIVA